MPLDYLSHPRCEQRSYHRREQIDPKKIRLPRKSSRPKLPSRIYAPSRGGTKHRNRYADCSTHNPRNERRKPGNCQTNPDQKNDDPHTNGFSREQ